LDPIADKLLLTSVYLSLGWSHLAPPWVVGLVIGRDLLILAMVGIAFAFTSFRDFPPSTSGKVSTAIQILTAVVILASQTAAGSSWKPAVRPLIWLTAAAAIYSGVDYVSRAILTLRDKTDRRSENPCP
jgi:cardiolipin synthase